MVISAKNRYIPESDWVRIKKHLPRHDLYLCEILKATGFRVDDILESVNLNWAFADLGLIVIAEKKTEKIREFPSNGWIQTLVRSFRTAYGIPPSYLGSSFIYFAPSWKKLDTHLNRSTLFRHFQTACKRAGLSDKGYTIHSLRKCYAVELYRKTRSLLEVQKSLNHDRMETTMIYLMDALEFMI